MGPSRRSGPFLQSGALTIWGPLKPGEVDERTGFQKLVSGRFRRRRAKIGDVAEFPTSRGLVYAQYTHEHPVFTSVVRVLEGFHEEHPQDLDALVAGPLLFETLIGFRSMTYTGQVDIVRNVPVPEERCPFPLFRTAQRLDPETGLWSNWWLWDGERSGGSGILSQDRSIFPIVARPTTPSSSHGSRRGGTTPTSILRPERAGRSVR